MAKKIQLSIAEPCHENWDAMSPDAKGKFCGSCQKQVVDFSAMSDRQVAEFFKKPSTGSVCGRFMTDQLERPLEIPRKRIPWLKYFFQFVIPAFLVSLKASAQRTQGRIRVNTVMADTAKKPVYNDRIKMGMVARPTTPVADTTPVKEPVQMLKGEIYVKPDTLPVCVSQIMGGISVAPVVNKKELEGIVMNSKADPIPYATVGFGKDGKVMADEFGVFKIKRNLLRDQSEIVVSSVNYDTRKMLVSSSYRGQLIVQLEDKIMMTEVVVAAVTGQIRCSTTLGSVTRVMGDTVFAAKKYEELVVNKIEPVSKENTLFLYPNPAAAGTSVNISLKDFEEGYHQLQFINQSGQIIRQQEVWIDAGARLMNTEIPLVADGTYFMILTNKKTGKKYTEKIIIQ